MNKACLLPGEKALAKLQLVLLYNKNVSKGGKHTLKRSVSHPKRFSCQRYETYW